MLAGYTIDLRFMLVGWEMGHNTGDLASQIEFAVDDSTIKGYDRFQGKNAQVAKFSVTRGLQRPTIE